MKNGKFTRCIIHFHNNGKNGIFEEVVEAYYITDNRIFLFIISKPWLLDVKWYSWAILRDRSDAH